MLNFLAYIILGLLISTLYFMFFTDILELSLIYFFLFIYILVFYYFIILSLDFIGIIILLIYGGGLLILILFTTFLLPSELLPKKVTSSTNSMLLVGGGLMLYFFILSLLSYFNLVEKIYTYNIFAIHLNSIVSVPSFVALFSCSNMQFLSYKLLLKTVGYYMYTQHCVSFFLLTILLFLSLLGIILLTHKYYALSSNFYILNMGYSRQVMLNISLLNSHFIGCCNVVFSNYLSLYDSYCIYFSPILVLFVCFLFFIFALYCIIFLSRISFIKLLILFEILFLGVFLGLGCISFLLDDITGLIFILYLLGILAAETAIGLSLFVNLFTKGPLFDNLIKDVI